MTKGTSGFTPLETAEKQMRDKTSLTGFTLIELIIAVSISVMIMAALYFSLRNALESSQISQDQLLLQHISSRIMEELTEGMPDTYGLRDTLEITDGSSEYITTVMPWTDSDHQFSSGIYLYTLNKHIKPGTGAPIVEAILPGAEESKIIPAALMDLGRRADRPQVRLKIGLPGSSQLKFTFHPDYKKDADVLTTFRYDAGEKAVLIEDKDGTRSISANAFAVKITRFLIRYFDNMNQEVFISSENIPKITGVEIAFKAESKSGYERETATFISFRNAPTHSGHLILTQGARIPIPNSHDIRAFFLTNLYGIDNNDSIILDAKPHSGKDWRLSVHFTRAAGSMTPLIEQYDIEYPAGNKVYTGRPRTPAEMGLNLLSLSPNGLYDYDDDGVQDPVILDGKVTLEAEKVDVGGASIFINP